MIDVVGYLELHVLGGDDEAHGSRVGEFGEEPEANGDVVAGTLILHRNGAVQVEQVGNVAVVENKLFKLWGEASVNLDRVQNLETEKRWIIHRRKEP